MCISLQLVIKFVLRSLFTLGHLHFKVIPWKYITVYTFASVSDSCISIDLMWIDIFICHALMFDVMIIICLRNLIKNVM